MLRSIAPNHKDNPFLDRYASYAQEWNDYVGEKDDIEGSFSEYGIEFQTTIERGKMKIDLNSRLKMNNVSTNVIPLKSPIVGETRMSIYRNGLPEFQVKQRTIFSEILRLLKLGSWTIVGEYMLKPKLADKEVYQFVANFSNSLKLVSINCSPVNLTMHLRSYCSPVDWDEICSSIKKRLIADS